MKLFNVEITDDELQILVNAINHTWPDEPLAPTSYRRDSLLWALSQWFNWNSPRNIVPINALILKLRAA